MKKLLLGLLLLSTPAISQTLVQKPVVCGDYDTFTDFVTTKKLQQLAKITLSNQSYVIVWVGEVEVLITEQYPEGVCVISGGKGITLNDKTIKEFQRRGTN